MHLLILVSTEMELEVFAKRFNLRRNEFGFSLRYGSRKTDILITGVGSPSTVYELMSYLHSNLPDLVLQIGFAGSFHRDLLPGSMVEVISECFGDLGLDNSGQIKPLAKAFPGLKGSVNRIANPSKTKLPGKHGVTVNLTSGSAERERLMLDLWQPDVETMEGAAGMWVCQQEKIPYLQVRVISNYTGQRDSAQWDTALAQQSLSDWLTTYLQLS